MAYLPPKAIGSRISPALSRLLAGRKSVVTEARFLRGIRPKEDVKKGKEFANSKVSSNMMGNQTSIP